MARVPLAVFDRDVPVSSFTPTARAAARQPPGNPLPFNHREALT
jgi:hypothetical protein